MTNATPVDQLDTRLATIQQTISTLPNPIPIIEDIEAELDILNEEEADPEALRAISDNAIALLEAHYPRGFEHHYWHPSRLKEPLAVSAPHNRNRLGVIIGAIIHPFVIFIPTLILVLKDVALREAVGWIVLIAVVLVGPAMVLIRRARKREQYTYQRGTRHQLYITAELSVPFRAALIVVLDAPERLMFSLVLLCIWIPLQYVVNARLTKISAHTAVRVLVGFG